MGVAGCNNTLRVFSFNTNHGYAWLYLANVHNYAIIVIGYTFIVDIVCAVILVVVLARPMISIGGTRTLVVLGESALIYLQLGIRKRHLIHIHYYITLIYMILDIRFKSLTLVSGMTLNFVKVTIFIFPIPGGLWF